jgi:hypothetical protein
MLLLAMTGAAAEPAERAPAAVSQSGKGMILCREAPKADWKVVGDKAELFTNDLIIGLPGSVIQSRDGAVRMQLLADFHSPLPVLEPAVVLHPAGDADLDFTLERGRVDVISQKERDPVRVRAHVWGQTWEATLHGSGTRLALEVLGRWPPGARFHHSAGTPSEPVARLLLLDLHGDVDIKHDGITQAMSAPPGPALLVWNSLTGADASPQRLDKLPEWAQPPQDAAGKADVEKRIQLRDRVAAALAEHPVGEVLDQLAGSDDARERRVGVILMGALDDVQRLGRTLHETKHADTWDMAVVAMRHWLGRGPGQDRKLYDGLTKVKGFTPVQAEAVIDMLFGFNETDRSRPELYQLLINYLGSNKLALRGLAHWHLVRLVPGGSAVPFDLHATAETRKEEQAQWKKLVPSGEVPKAPASTGSPAPGK